VESRRLSFKGRLGQLSGDRLPFDDILLSVSFALVGLNSSYSNSNSSTSAIKLAWEFVLLSLEDYKFMIGIVYLLLDPSRLVSIDGRIPWGLISDAPPSTSIASKSYIRSFSNIVVV